MQWFRFQTLWLALCNEHEAVLSEELMRTCLGLIHAQLGPPSARAGMLAFENGVISWANDQDKPRLRHEVIPGEVLAEAAIRQFNLPINAVSPRLELAIAG